MCGILGFRMRFVAASTILDELRSLPSKIVAYIIHLRRIFRDNLDLSLSMILLEFFDVDILREKIHVLSRLPGRYLCEIRKPFYIWMKKKHTNR